MASRRSMGHRWAVQVPEGLLAPDWWGISAGEWAVNSPPGPVTFRTRGEARDAILALGHRPQGCRVVKVRAKVVAEVVG